MATNLQKNLANNIVKNLKRKKPLNKQELVESSGYSHNTATKQLPAVFEQKGVQEELKNLGFSEEKAKDVVSSIMNDPDVDAMARLKATDQVFKVKGSYAPEKTQALNLNVKADIKDFSKFEAIRDEFEAKLKASLSQNE